MIYHEERLDGVHPHLAWFIRSLIRKLSAYWPDWLIICGWRNEAEQHAAFISGASKVDWPNSKHNHTRILTGKFYEPQTGLVKIADSMAVDLSPYPYDQGRDVNRLYLIAGYAICLAEELGVKLRIGADWDGDLQTLDQRLNDPWHYELVVE